MVKKKVEEVAEGGAKAKGVIFEKNGISFELTNPIMISAFENQGYKRI